MNIRLPHRSLASLAMASLVALLLSSCMSSQESEPEPRPFAPRLVGTPPCARIRVEVAEWNMNGTATGQPNGNSNGFYRSVEADVSQNSLTVDGIPWGTTIYFRVSGIDTTYTVVWSSSGNVPDVPQPSVTIGSGGYQPQTISAPTIKLSSDPYAPQIQCAPSTSGSTWPAWTTDGSPVSETNPLIRIDKSKTQITVPLSLGQILSARCTDNFTWSPLATYQAPTGPTALPAQTGPGNDFSLSPTISVPSSSAGTITFSANTSSLAGFSNWKVVYRMNGTGTWLTQELSTGSGVSFNGSGNISAYLVAWNGTRWASGNASTANYPSGPTNPVAMGPGNEITAPILAAPKFLPGNISVSKPATTPDLTDWKVVYRIGFPGAWTIINYGTNSISVQTAGTMDVYLMGWSTSLNRWLSGAMSNVSYPNDTAVSTGPTTLPAQNGPGSDFMLSPTFTIPSNSSGTITFSANTSSFLGYSNWKVVSRMNNAGAWQVQDLTAATGVSFSGSGTISAYLVAWNGTKWASGNASTANYPSGPTNPVAMGPGNEITAPSLVAPNSLPGNISVSKTSSATDLVSWKVVYRFGSTGAWAMIDYGTNSISVQSAGSIDVYLMAWSNTQSRWLSGALSNVSYPNAPAVPNLIGEGTSLPAPTISVPASVPGKINFTVTSPDSTYTNWYVAAKFNDTGSYHLIRLDSSLNATNNGKVTAYLIAWYKSQGKWVSGPGATKTVGQSPSDVTIIASGGPLPTLVLNGTSYLPGTCTFSFPPTATTAGYSNWKVIYQLPGGTSWAAIDTGTPVLFYASGNVSAYLEAWSVSGQKWVSGPVNNLYVPTTPPVVNPPVFKDPNGVALDSIWEQDSTIISLQIAGSGTIYYTTDNSIPAPGMSTTSVWSSTQRLSFPNNLPRLTIQAVANNGSTTSSVAKLVVTRPVWTRQDRTNAGCIQSDGNFVVSCGDLTGPWAWDLTTDKWKPLDLYWPGGQTAQLLVTPKFVFTILQSGGVRRLDRNAAAGRFVELNVRTCPASVGGLAVVRDTLWASTATGPYFYNNVSDTWAAPTLPAGTVVNPKEGPAWSDGNVLWMAFGPELWRYGPSGTGPFVWEHWNSTYPNIAWLGPDPFSNAFAAMSYGTNFGQIGTAKMMASLNYLNTTNSAPVVQVVARGTNAYAATDDGTGGGGVVRATGWAALNWSAPERDWPMMSNQSVSSQGVAAFSAHGHDWLLASTGQGTYTIKLK